MLRSKQFSIPGVTCGHIPGLNGLLLCEGTGRVQLYVARLRLTCGKARRNPRVNDELTGMWRAIDYDRISLQVPNGF